MSDRQSAKAETFTRGIVEGFFGMPWPWEARRGFAGFMAQNGYDTYLYAPKGDGWFRKRWAEPLPGDHLEKLRDLCNAYHARGLNFGIGLSPFELYRDFSRAQRRRLAEKIGDINRTGADTLCILFDDMQGDIPDLAARQAAIMAEAAAQSDADHLLFCPTYYSFDPALAAHFGPMPAHYLEDLGRLLDPAIRIFWTGPGVFSAEYPADHLQSVADALQRRPLIWDNYPVNDSRALTPFLCLRPRYLDVDILQARCSGHMANPMNQAWLSRIPLHALARILRDHGADPGSLFREACRAVCGRELGDMIYADAGTFQDRGLDALSGEERGTLKDRYEAFSDAPCAREILDWLEGRYAFDPDCLT